MTRERRFCKRCDKRRIFEIRIRPSGHRQSDCVACRRRRGRERSPTRNTWKCMKDRCLNPNAINYSYYGGRGVTIHQEWIESFEAFVSYLVSSGIGLRPSGRTLDRIDATGDYVPGNIRWSTAKEQIENRRVNYKSRRKCYGQE